MSIDVNLHNKNFYTKTEDEAYVALGTGKYDVSAEIDDFGAIMPMVVATDDGLVVDNGTNFSVFAAQNTAVKIGKTCQYQKEPKVENGRASVKFDTTNIPVFVTAFSTPEQQIEQLRAIYAANRAQLPGFELNMTNVVGAVGNEKAEDRATLVTSSETFVLIPTISINLISDDDRSAAV